jgi:hypothetical protein
LGAILALALATPAVTAQPAGTAAKPAKLINAGGILSGELNALRASKAGERVATYQLTSEPRRLPPPNGLCNLEGQLKSLIGKEISLRVDEVACAQDAGQMSEAVVTKWSVITHH